MYKYTIKGYSFGSNGFILCSSPIIIKVKATTDHLAIEKAKQIANRSEYHIQEIEEI